MMRRNDEHERLEDLAIADALDALDDEDRRDLDALLAAHGPACADCASIRTRHFETAAALADSVVPVAPSPHATERLLAAAAATPQVTTMPAPSESRRPHGLWRTLAVAAAVVLLVGGGAIGYAVNGTGRSNPSTSALTDFVSQPNVRIAPFPATNGQRVNVLYRPGLRDGWIVGTGMAQPPGNHVYELWSLPAGTTRMQPAGTFQPDDHGAVRQRAKLAARITTLAVSVEPPGGSPQPTTPPIMVTKVKS